jgi:hypothetical protein
MGLAREAAQQGLSGKAYFDHIDKGMREVFAPAPPADKSEGGGPAGVPGGGKKGSFASLPAEAKAQCAEAGTMATVTEAQCVVAYSAFSAAGRDYFQTCPDGEGGCRLSEACFLGVYPRVGD